MATDTRLHVQRVMEKMGYHRNLGARMLTTHRSNIIEFMVMDVHFGIVLPKMSQYINAAGYSTLYSECTQENFADALDTAAARLVDGILLYAPKLLISDDELLEMSHGIPIVRRDYVLDSRLTWVGYSQEHATRLVVQHLVDLGHRQIAEITGSLDFINPRLRHETRLALLTAQGLEPGPSYTGDYSSFANAMKTGYEGVCEFLRRGAEFTAIMTVNDHAAAGARMRCTSMACAFPTMCRLPASTMTPLPPTSSAAHHRALRLRHTEQAGISVLLEQISDPDYRHHQHVLIPDLSSARARSHRNDVPGELKEGWLIRSTHEQEKALCSGRYGGRAGMFIEAIADTYRDRASWWHSVI